MAPWLSASLAALLYSLAFALRLADFLRGRESRKLPLLALASLAVAAHALAGWHQVFEAGKLNVSLIPFSALIFLLINAIVVLSSIREPLENLYLLLFPPTVAMLLLAAATNEHFRELGALPLGLDAHILLSVLSYSLMTIAALLALVLAWQNRRLHNHQPGGPLRALPPLLTIERLLFRFLAAGFVLLSAGLVLGFIYVDNILAQHLAHKTVFSLVAWVVYAVLLWGHFRRGWRGRIAAWWALGGFCSLMLAFWGTKFVLEVLLHRA
jgi:ABC-type uncharacterized transport system permease subunit